MATCQQLNTWLSEAEAALHDIAIGGKVVEIQDQNNERVTYSRSNITELRKYIADLTSTIGTQCNGSSLASKFGPLRPWF